MFFGPLYIFARERALIRCQFYFWLYFLRDFCIAKELRLLWFFFFFFFSSCCSARTLENYFNRLAKPKKKKKKKYSKSRFTSPVLCSTNVAQTPHEGKKIVAFSRTCMLSFGPILPLFRHYLPPRRESSGGQYFASL